MKEHPVTNSTILDGDMIFHLIFSKKSNIYILTQIQKKTGLTIHIEPILSALDNLQEYLIDSPNNYDIHFFEELSDEFCT